MASDSNISDGLDSEDEIENRDNGLIHAPPSDGDDTMVVDESGAPARKASGGGDGNSVTPETVLAFVRRLARDGTRQLSSSERDLAKIVLSIRKKWLLAASSKQALSRSRRKSSLSAAAVVNAAMLDDDSKPRKRRTTSRTAPDVVETPSELVYKGSVLEILPQRKKVDALLQSVAAFFHQPNKIGIPPGMERYIMPDQDHLHYSTLDALLSPLRKQSLWETWSPIQLALFEAGIYTLGKNFHEIARLIDNKTTGDIVNLYYHWKQSSHYNLWKSMGKPILSQQVLSPGPAAKSIVGQPGQDGADVLSN